MADVVTSRAIGGDAPARDVDSELDRLIEKRAKAASKASAEADLWEMSVRRHHDAIRRRNRAAWFAHFCTMAENHARISQDYAERAERLCSEATEGGTAA